MNTGNDWALPLEQDAPEQYLSKITVLSGEPHMDIKRWKTVRSSWEHFPEESYCDIGNINLVYGRKEEWQISQNWNNILTTT